MTAQIKSIDDLQLNTMSHARFLETVRRVRPTARIVHASTRQIYGRPRYLEFFRRLFHALTLPASPGNE